MFRAAAVLVGSLLISAVAFAQAGEICVYAKEDGSFVQVRSRAEIPARYLALSQCLPIDTVRKMSAEQPPDQRMPAPDEVNLKGSTGRAQLTTAIGAIDLRWPRAVTEIFGRTPERAVSDAAMAVSRALQSGSFMTEAQAVNQPWKIVFMDENHPEPGIPIQLMSDCHPGWMTPPSNIYIVAQRAASFCSGGRVPQSEADSRLATILVHEMGHAIEYQMLRTQFERSRMRAEGFASWFEQYASDFSGVISNSKVRSYYQGLARLSVSSAPQGWSFRGSADDYARASMFFNAVVSRRGVAGLMDVYRTMERSNLDLVPAIQQSVGWDERKLNDEVSRLLK